MPPRAWLADGNRERAAAAQTLAAPRPRAAKKTRAAPRALGRCASAAEWVARDLQNQLDLYRALGHRAPRTRGPTPSELEDARERLDAARLQCKICTTPEHAGDRVLTPDKLYRTGRMCKACKVAEMQQRRTRASGQKM